MTASKKAITKALAVEAAAWLSVRNGNKPRVAIPDVLLSAYAVALVMAPMPLSIHQGSAQDRRAWCRENGAPVVNATQVCGKVGKRADVTFRQTLARHQEGMPTTASLAYQPVYGTNSQGICAPEMYVYSVR